jgi:hypothetical protein
VYKKQF